METMTEQSEKSFKVEPQAEHDWLQQLVGEWTFESEALMGPDRPPAKGSGTETVRSLGDLWIVAEGQGDMPGCGESTMLITLGYAPQEQRYVGTWIGSMMTHLWLYDGEQTNATTLTLNSEGPSMANDGKMAHYKDVIEFKTADHRVMTSHALGEDGKWHQFMTVNYRRN
jgi:Protein of unknown function (DUF1579)